MPTPGRIAAAAPVAVAAGDVTLAGIEGADVHPQRSRQPTYTGRDRDDRRYARRIAAADVIHDYLSALPGSTRRLAHAEWGLTVEAEAAAGWPLDIGLRIADGLLRVQAFVARHDEALDPWLFLAWNRQTRFIRFGCARNGDLWIHGDMPVDAVDARSVDRLLGLVAEGAAVARRHASEARASGVAAS